VNPTLAGFLYLAAAVLFILGLKRLSSPATATRGNQLAAVGMLIAIVVTLHDQEVVEYGVVVAGLAVGAVVGAILAVKVEMTSMPELVAAFNGFGGGASAVVAVAELLRADAGTPTRTLVTIALSILIGTVTFSGSFVAFGKLQGSLPGRPVGFPGQIVVDAMLAAGAVAAAVWLTVDVSEPAGWIVMALAFVLGITRTLPIGGADMPVVISFLNSLSGVAAAAAGFVIESNALIVSGALVGASGLILTNIMVTAMNRTLPNVLAGGFGGDAAFIDADPDKVARRASADDVAVTLAYAREVIVVPGYGLAVAQAQHVMRELADALGERGVNVRYAIHPVAGRMPGHMNVLLAEADVPYDRLFDLDDINRDFARADVALVVGANDVVNPLARQPDSPVSGMPILDVDHATTVVVVKRSLSPGFAGIDNPLFYLDNTLMLFADAKQGLADVVSAVADA
jgi:NAD(P) transhydrogenase subunit beta